MPIEHYGVDVVHNLGNPISPGPVEFVLSLSLSREYVHQASLAPAHRSESNPPPNPISATLPPPHEDCQQTHGILSLTERMIPPPVFIDISTPQRTISHPPSISSGPAPTYPRILDEILVESDSAPASGSGMVFSSTSTTLACCSFVILCG